MLPDDTIPVDLVIETMEAFPDVDFVIIDSQTGDNIYIYAEEEKQ